jgi:hypothetical protein
VIGLTAVLVDSRTGPPGVLLGTPGTYPGYEIGNTGACGGGAGTEETAAVLFGGLMGQTVVESGTRERICVGLPFLELVTVLVV